MHGIYRVEYVANDFVVFGYEIGLNLSNGQESGAEERNPGEIITEISIVT